MWNSTRKMAEAIARGIELEDPKVKVKLLNSSKVDKNDIITEVFKSKGILLGSPTVNNGYLHSIAGILEMIKGMKFQDKYAAAFGSYGWSGEVVKNLTQDLKDAGFNVINDGHRSLWVPDDEETNVLIDYGKEIAKEFI